MIAEASDSDRVVIGVDGSRHSIVALRTDAEFAGVLGLPLVAVHSWSRSGLHPATEIPDGDFPLKGQAEQTASRLVEEAVERALGEHRQSEVPTGIRYGHAAQVLLGESRSARLLMLGR